MSLSHWLTGSDPQKVIEPTANTAPPPGQSNQVMSARISALCGWPGMVVMWVSCSSGTSIQGASGGWFSDRATTTAFSGEPSRLSTRSSSKPAAPWPEKPSPPTVSAVTPSKIQLTCGLLRAAGSMR